MLSSLKGRCQDEGIAMANSAGPSHCQHSSCEGQLVNSWSLLQPKPRQAEGLTSLIRCKADFSPPVIFLNQHTSKHIWDWSGALSFGPLTTQLRQPLPAAPQQWEQGGLWPQEAAHQPFHVGSQEGMATCSLPVKQFQISFVMKNKTSSFQPQQLTR